MKQVFALQFAAQKAWWDFCRAAESIGLNPDAGAAVIEPKKLIGPVKPDWYLVTAGLPLTIAG